MSKGCTPPALGPPVMAAAEGVDRRLSIPTTSAEGPGHETMFKLATEWVSACLSPAVRHLSAVAVVVDGSSSIKP